MKNQFRNAFTFKHTSLWPWSIICICNRHSLLSNSTLWAKPNTDQKIKKKKRCLYWACTHVPYPYPLNSTCDNRLFALYQRLGSPTQDWQCVSVCLCMGAHSCICLCRFFANTTLHTSWMSYSQVFVSGVSQNKTLHTPKDKCILQWKQEFFLENEDHYKHAWVFEQ